MKSLRICMGNKTSVVLSVIVCLRTTADVFDDFTDWVREESVIVKEDNFELWNPTEDCSGLCPYSDICNFS